MQRATDKAWRKRAATETGRGRWLDLNYLPQGFEPTAGEEEHLKRCDACGRWTERYYSSEWGRTCQPCAEAS